jgi:hypothetical protein
MLARARNELSLYGRMPDFFGASVRTGIAMRGYCNGRVRRAPTTDGAAVQ